METMTLFSWAPKITVDGDCSHEIKRHLLLERKPITNIDSILKSRDITFLTKVCLVIAMVFFSGHVQMWELDRKEGWKPKNWCCLIVVLKKTLESPLGSKEMKPVNPKGTQPCIFIGLIDAEVEAPIVWSPDAKHRQTLEKTMKLGKIEGRRRSNREWDGWMASPTQWTWIWANSGRQWGTGKAGMLQSKGSQSWTWLSDWTTKDTLECNRTKNNSMSITGVNQNISGQMNQWAPYSKPLFSYRISVFKRKPT